MKIKDYYHYGEVSLRWCWLLIEPVKTSYFQKIIFNPSFVKLQGFIAAQWYLFKYLVIWISRKNAHLEDVLLVWSNSIVWHDDMATSQIPIKINNFIFLPSHSHCFSKQTKNCRGDAGEAANFDRVKPKATEYLVKI